MYKREFSLRGNNASNKMRFSNNFGNRKTSNTSNDMNNKISRAAMPGMFKVHRREYSRNCVK